MREVIVGIGGAAGDGLDKTGDTLAKTSGRLGLHVYAYNSYQSIIRGGHIWLRVRIGQEKVRSHGDQLDALIALNQDTIERHAPTVAKGGAIIVNGDRLKVHPELVGQDVQVLELPMKEVTKQVVEKHGAILPVMQNTVALGAFLYLAQLDFDEAAGVLTDTFKHKGQEVIDKNVALLKCGYEYAKANAKPIREGWEYSREKRPFITGNEAFAMGAIAAGCKFYSAYPMTPASTILHWMATHAHKAGTLVKQCEDELSVINMAIGAGIAGTRAMCATAGGGFALMTEAIGMAGIMEVPVVCVEVQRGGPSTGLPTKTEQADLNQVFGASQGDFPRMIVAPHDAADCFHTAVEAFNVAEKFQMPVLIMSDLLLSEHPETMDRDAVTHDVKIDRGELVTEWPEEKGKYKRYKFTKSGVSPRALPGTANTLYVSPSDDHDEESILISDMYTSPPMRRKIQEKRQIKMENLLKQLPAPQLEGPSDADVTLVTWGSTRGVVTEAIAQLADLGVKANHLNVKYILPFHTKEVTEILSKSKKKISVEVNYTSQFARYLKAETGISMDHHINKYDGEPFEPHEVARLVKDTIDGKKVCLNVSESDAREMAYHYIRTHLNDKVRPVKVIRESENGHGEPVWKVELTERVTGQPGGEMEIGVETGATYSYTPAE